MQPNTPSSPKAKFLPTPARWWTALSEARRGWAGAQTLQATRCGHSFPNPSGGWMRLSRATTSRCLMRPLGQVGVGGRHHWIGDTPSNPFSRTHQLITTSPQQHPRVCQGRIEGQSLWVGVRVGGQKTGSGDPGASTDRVTGGVG